MRMSVEEALLNNPNIEKDDYSYSFSVASLADGVSTTDNIQISANAAFVITKTTYSAAIAAATQTDSTRVIPLLTIFMEDGGSGRNLMREAVPIPSIAGSGELPFIWSWPRLVMPTSSIQATIANYSAATTYTNIFFTLHGYQVFEYQKLMASMARG